jgi:sulfur-oxidizing protein SoxX
MKIWIALASALGVSLLPFTAGQADDSNDPAGDVLRTSMVAKNHVGLDRLDATELQLACSNKNDWPSSNEKAQALQAAALAAVEYPDDGRYLGDWREGEKIAQNGRGMQYSDDPADPNGGNCYACHQLDPDEIAAGNIGPSLTGYGQRGQSEQVLKYTWAKIWNPNAYLVCSHMPRFGDAGILTPDQIRHVMALLLDPESPVNR